MLSSGSVIGPTFHFNIPKLKFGVVSYGKCQMFFIHMFMLMYITQKAYIALYYPC